MKLLPMNKSNQLRTLVYECLLELSTEEGINASGKDEVYGCIFGRDSALTILKILKAHSKNPTPELLPVCKKALLTLISLQGQQFNIECGEQPGKFIHEFRKDNLERFLNFPDQPPWFIHPEGVIKNYDSVDSTPLTLIALYNYWQQTKDNQFLVTVLPAVEAGLNWIISFGDLDKDLLIEYDFPIERKSGGLLVQSWTDSHESLKQADGTMPKYPIAPIEVQGYAWLALKLWGSFYKLQSPKFGRKLLSQAKKMKKRFNQTFILRDQGFYFGAQALDGDKNQIKTITGNPLLCLWASYTEGLNKECIIESKYIDDFVKRAFLPDLFVENGGIRTMSSQSGTFNPNEDSYHNGSFWPILNSLIQEGLENWGYFDGAAKLKQLTLDVIEYFNCPIELYNLTNGGDFIEYRSPTGQVGCRTQAWSAAAALDLLTVSA